jgi:glycine cleavage system aminomethyltransferase T
LENRVVLVQGPDAGEFLQRICSQDIEALAENTSTWGAFLNNKGRLEARAGIARIGNRFYFDTPAESVELLAGLLDRYHFTEDLSIEVQKSWSAIDLLGSQAQELLGLGPSSARLLADGGLLIGCHRLGLSWARCFGSEDSLAKIPELTELPELSSELAECHRILRGELRMGVDASAKTLAMEARLEDHISTSKYGHVNKQLSLLEIDSQEACSAETSLHETEGGQAVGRVTSSCPIPGSDRSLALAYLPEAFLGEGTGLRVGNPEGPMARVCEFPGE